MTVSKLASGCALALVTLHFLLANGALITDPAQLGDVNYDYIIVGAGIGGSVTAGRLAKDPNLRILLIEAGVSNEGVQSTIVPFFAPSATPNTILDWNYTSTPQAALNGRTITLPSGRILGGGSSVNYMTYSRGPRDDYDYMAKVTGDPSWSFDSMFPYLTKYEQWTAPRDGHDTQGQYNPQYHGHTGPIRITLPNYPTSLDNRILRTLGTGPGFDYVEDMNSGKPLGFGWMQSTNGGGMRSSAATGYLTGQPNLDILIQTTATRLVHSGEKNGVPHFGAVEVATAPGAPRFVFNARTEVILAAGAVGTPKLLMLSGIGPKSGLTKIGITTVVNSKDVGHNLQDHGILMFPYEANDTYTIPNITADIPVLLPEWEATKSGPLSNSLENILGWGRLPEEDPYAQSYLNPTFGPNTPHFEYLFINGFLAFSPDQIPVKPHYVTVGIAISSTTSRGTVTLNSSDPFDRPAIDPAYLTTKTDLHVMVEAAKGLHRFLSAPAWDDYVIRPHESIAHINFSDDTVIEDYARKYTASEFHLSGTASISSSSSSDGVVDPKLCVKGVAGLRIVDASVFPQIPTAHPQAAIYAIAEKAVDMIKAESCSGKKSKGE